MNERNNKLELLGSAPIPKALMALGIPIMIGMLINALYNLVDAYFVAGLGKSQMGAISIVFPLGQVVVGLGLMFGNGAASYLSRLLGRGDKDTADKVASTALYSSILIGAIIILLSTIFLKPILVMVGATETIMPYASTYARIYVLSCILKHDDRLFAVAGKNHIRVILPFSIHHFVIIALAQIVEHTHNVRASRIAPRQAHLVRIVQQSTRNGKRMIEQCAAVCAVVIDRSGRIHAVSVPRQSRSCDTSKPVV